MKTLYEGILADMEDQITAGDYEADKIIITKFIADNYTLYNGQVWWGEKTDDGKYIVNSTGYLKTSKKRLTKLTNDLFVWGTVREFSCADSKYLESLEGAPIEVIRGFDCSKCTKLKNLIGAPKTVGGRFYAFSCTNLESLEGAPALVKDSFSVDDCKKLKSLDYFPKRVECGIYISNTGIKSLNGLPEAVDGNLSICGTDITTLKWCPKVVAGYFDASGCIKLKNIDDLPAVVGGRIDLTDTAIDKEKYSRENLKQHSQTKTVFW